MFNVYLHNPKLTPEDLQLCKDHNIDITVEEGCSAGILKEADVTAFLSDFSHKLVSIQDDTLIISNQLGEF